MMNKQEVIQVLKQNAFTDQQIVSKRGGVEILAAKRVPVFEFDYDEFIGMFKGRIDEKKIHWLDPWTFSIECE